MTLRDAILKNLDAVIWRSCGDLAQRINANSIDVGCALKRLVDTERLAERRTDKCDNPINFRYRLLPPRRVAKAALDTSLPKAAAPQPLVVTEAMRIEAAQYIQELRLTFKPAVIEELLTLTPSVQSRIASMSRLAGGFAAQDWAIKRVLEYKRKAQEK